MPLTLKGKEVNVSSHTLFTEQEESYLVVPAKPDPESVKPNGNSYLD